MIYSLQPSKPTNPQWFQMIGATFLSQGGGMRRLDASFAVAGPGAAEFQDFLVASKHPWAQRCLDKAAMLVLV